MAEELKIRRRRLMDPMFPQSLSGNEHKRIQKLERLLKSTDWSAASKAGLIAAYQDKYAKPGKFNKKGKWQRWDERTDTWYNTAEAIKFIKLERFGTETPEADLKYLRAKNFQEQRVKGGAYNDPQREKLSRKLVIDDKNKYSSVYAKEQAARKEKDEEKLRELKKNTSFYRLDQRLQKEAQGEGAIERERFEWGPGGQPNANASETAGDANPPISQPTPLGITNKVGSGGTEYERVKVGQGSYKNVRIEEKSDKIVNTQKEEVAPVTFIDEMGYNKQQKERFNILKNAVNSAQYSRMKDLHGERKANEYIDSLVNRAPSQLEVEY
tara:strand:- start:306 stop:1283 length:978 start_codon:yes stop_codon:yes gene_type:complete